MEHDQTITQNKHRNSTNITSDKQNITDNNAELNSPATTAYLYQHGTFITQAKKTIAFWDGTWCSLVDR